MTAQMSRKRARRPRQFDNFVLLPIVLFALFPLYWMTSSSIKPTTELAAIPPTWYPTSVTFEHYQRVLADGRLIFALANSAFIAGAVTVATLVLGSMAAYACTHWLFPGSRQVLYVSLFTQLLPQASVLVPVYLLWAKLGLIDSQVGLAYTYVAFAVPVGVWILTSYFQTISYELTESALIDGASRAQILLLVVLPLARPGLASAAIFTFLWSWSEFLFALVMLRDFPTITVALARLVGQHFVELGQLMAASTVSTVIPFLVFLPMQRYFIAGLTRGAVKE